METVRIGVIGCGHMGRRHVDCANKHPAAQVVAVADPVGERAEELAEAQNVPKTYPNGAALIEAPDIDAVTLALPTCGRTDLALKALANGKHVLTEKPVAMNAAEVREMIAAKGDLIAGCCSSRARHLESSKRVTELIATGVLGRIRSVHCRCMMPLTEKKETPPPAWRLTNALNGGGIAMNWGCYDMDYLLGIAGWTLRPENALAQIWTVPEPFESYIAPGSDAETHFTALVRFAGGAAMTIERAEYVATTPSNTWEIVGDRGSLHLHMTPAEDKKIVLDKGDAEKGVVSEVVWSGKEDWSVMHTGVIHDFIDAVREKRPCATSLERALIVQQITDAIYQSAESGEAVRIH